MKKELNALEKKDMIILGKFYESVLRGKENESNTLVGTK